VVEGEETGRTLRFIDRPRPRLAKEVLDRCYYHTMVESKPDTRVGQARVDGSDTSRVGGFARPYI
jgi:hypothetical protein